MGWHVRQYVVDWPDFPATTLNPTPILINNWGRRAVLLAIALILNRDWLRQTLNLGYRQLGVGKSGPSCQP